MFWIDGFDLHSTCSSLFIYLMQQVYKTSEHGVILFIFIFNMQSKLLLVMHFNQIAIRVWETVSLHNVMGANKHR